MDFLPAKIADYASQHSEEESDLLKEVNRFTYSHMVFPRMLSGHIQGRVLAMFSKMIKPKYVLEIGTYTGYSALCLAEGLAKDGKLYSLEANPEYHHVAQNFVAKSKYAKQIELICEDAHITLMKLQKPWDIVFIDADKESYYQYFQSVLPHVKSGGYIIADNVLWSGKVVDEIELQKDSDTQSLHQFNQLVCSDDKVVPVLLPIRDGMMVLCKR